MSRYLATYDIGDNRRRRRVARVLQEYGQRIQWSVFEVDLEPQEVAELRSRLGPVLGKKDAFEIIPIDATGNRKRYRWQRPVETRESVIVIN